tara:strand:- start:1602 stop:2984 length:1383 start_codon:yes stop_codon:yes gene_type:complete
MNPKLNKKVKKFLDAYFKGTSASSPEAHHALMFILKGALTDANFHSTSKKVDKLFPKAKNAKYFGKRDWENSLEDKGVDIATMAKWDGHDIIDAIGFFVSMYVGRPLGSKIEALKNESFKREHKLLENLSVLVEKNVPTNPSKWSYYKSQAKKKFDVYPSAYANAWAAKQYKAAGGGWRKTKGESIKVPEEDTVNETMKPSQVSKAISKMKKLLMKKWQKRGGYENFGQRELNVMKDKLNYNPYGTPDERKIAKMLDGLDNWAMNYDGNMRESVINEISAEGGLKRVIKGQTREVEGIKLSVPMAQAMLDWFNSSPYGRKYPKAKKARLHLSLGIMMGFGLDRYAKHKGAKDELKYIKTLAKAMREDNTLRESTIKHLKSLNEAKYNFKDDAMTAYMKGKISAQELDKIAKNDFNSSVATKKELQNFLNSGYMKELMANTYGLKVPAMEKKVKELMKYAS